jgi:hypothetical protein
VTEAYVPTPLSSTLLESCLFAIIFEEEGDRDGAGGRNYIDRERKLRKY